MEKRPARVAAIHDLSGFGRCSISVILPVLSAMGVQVCPVPTAVLSSHTGGLGDPVIRDLTDYIEPALRHYQSLGVEFEAVYTGFLGSGEQVDCCLEFFKAYPKALKIVDPVMGDNGRPYRTCTPELRRRMSELAAAADIITPNITEAAMLLEESYPAAPLTRSEAKSMLLRLSHMGPKRVVITGAELAQAVAHVLAPGDGTLPMKDYLKVLSDRGYTGGITPELWGTTYHHCAERAMEKSLAFLRENSL